MTDKRDHEPSLLRKCERALQTQDKSNELFPVENFRSDSHTTLQPKFTTFFDEIGGFIDKWHHY